MRHPRTLAALVTAGIVFAACGDTRSSDESTVTVPPVDSSDPTSSDAPDAPMALDGSWVLISGSLDGDPIETSADWDVTLTIDGSTVSGTAACNGYGGTASIGDEFEHEGSFVVGDLAQTEMGCEPAVMELEQRYLSALHAVDAYELAANLALAATGTGTSLLFDRLEPVPTADIAGTTWVLDTVIAGEAATNSPLMELATLTLHDDGTLSGSTSCRRMEGEWIVSGAEVLFTSFSVIEDPAAGDCAPESADLGNTIVSVLGDGFTATVEGQRLTVMASGGEGLSYTAAP